MTRAREVSRLITTPPSIYATDSEASAGYLTLSSASSTYLAQVNNRPAFKNLIINGAMQIAQRGTSVSSITTGGYRTVDRFSLDLNTLGTWTMSVENDAPTGSGFRKSAKVLCTTADTSPAADDYFAFGQVIEGQNLQAIKKGTASAEQLTLSFWVKSNTTGTYIVNFYDLDNNREISKSYTISVSGTWEKKIITLPADTTGAFDNDNAGSMIVNFFLSVGSNRNSGTLNSSSWSSSVNANRAVGLTNLASATNNYWQITGIQLEIGSTNTDFEFLPVQQEFDLCQRYYQQVAQFNTFWCTSVRQAAGPVIFMTPFRAAPNTYGSTTGYFRYGPGGQRNIVTSSFSDINEYACYAIINDDGAATPFTTNYSTVVRLVQGFSAEL